MDALSPGVVFGLVLGVVMAAVAGCGGRVDPHAAGRTAKLELAFTHRGEPLTVGMVTLAAAEPGNDVGGMLGTNGIVRIAAVPGRYTVVVNLPPVAIARGQEPPPPSPDREKVPRIVQSSDTSPWKIEAREGVNRFDFDLDIK